MDENLLNDEQLRQSFLRLKKFAKQVETDYNKLQDLDYGEEEWKKDGMKINSNMLKFENSLKELTRDLQIAKDNGTASQNTISKIEDDLEKINEKNVDMVKAMREKIENYDTNFNEEDNNNKEENDEQEGEQKQELVLDLMNNEEILQQRRKELQDIHKTSAMIKDTTAQMAVKLEEQGEMLNNVEDHVIKTEDNVEKAGKEINKANEYSKGNTKRLCCIIIIIVIAIGVVLSIVLSLVFN